MEFIKGNNCFYQEKDGLKIAEITYQPLDDQTVVVDHTFVDPILRGQGIAEQLVDIVVEEMKSQGKKIKPSCPYVIELFNRKPEKYGDILSK